MCLTLGACAIGNTYDFKSAVPQLAVKTERTVSVSVSDQRPYVLSGDNTPEWVGLIRGGTGIPFGVHTRSGATFASDLTMAIIGGLRANGVQAGTEKGERSIVITVFQWKSDKYINTKLEYNLQADVLDQQGNIVISNTAKDTVALETFGGAEYLVLENFKRVAKALLEDGKIVSALR